MAESDQPGQENSDPNVQKAKERAEQRQREQRTNAPNSMGQPGGANKGVDMNDINLDVKGEEKKGPGFGSNPSRPTRGPNRASADEDEKEEDLDGYDDEGAPFFRIMINRFPKTI